MLQISDQKSPPQDSFPARFGGIHFVNQPWYIHAMYTIIKPFLKDKTRKRVKTQLLHMHNIHYYKLLLVQPLSLFSLTSSSSHPHPQIFLHGNNLNSLHQLIQPECLPSEFGGTLPPYDMGIWARTLLGPDYNDETEYTLTYDALHVRESCGGGDKEMMKR